MSKEQQAETKQHKAQRPSPTVEAAPLAENLPAFPGLSAFSGLPDHATARPLRQSAILRSRQTHGNHHVHLDPFTVAN